MVYCLQLARPPALLCNLMRSLRHAMERLLHDGSLIAGELASRFGYENSPLGEAELSSVRPGVYESPPPPLPQYNNTADLHGLSRWLWEDEVMLVRQARG